MKTLTPDNSSEAGSWFSGRSGPPPVGDLLEPRVLGPLGQALGVGRDGKVSLQPVQSRAVHFTLSGLRAAGLKTASPEVDQVTGIFQALPCLAMTSHTNCGTLPIRVQVEKQGTPLPHSTGRCTVDFFLNPLILLSTPIFFPFYFRLQLQFMPTLSSSSC